LNYFEEALTIFKEIDYRYGMADALFDIIFIYESQGNLPKAMERTNEALKLAEQLGNYEDIARYASMLGAIYFKQDKIDKALELCQWALDLLIKAGQEDEEGIQVLEEAIQYIKDTRF